MGIHDAEYEAVYSLIKQGPQKTESPLSFARSASTTITSIASELAAKAVGSNSYSTFRVLGEMNWNLNAELAAFYQEDGTVNPQTTQAMGAAINSRPKVYDKEYLPQLVDSVGVRIPDRESPLDVMHNLHPNAYFLLASELVPDVDFLPVDCDIFVSTITPVIKDDTTDYDDRMIAYIIDTYQRNADHIVYSYHPARLSVARSSLYTANNSWQTVKTHQANIQLASGKPLAETRLTDYQFTYFDNMPRNVHRHYKEKYPEPNSLVPSLMVVYKLLQDAKEYRQADILA